MADVVDLIQEAHRQLEVLLERAESSDPEQMMEILQRVAWLLGPHSEAEESFVYPAIRDHDDREDEKVQDSVAEHHHIEHLLEELSQEDPSGPGYDGKLAAMIGELRHHVREEEHDLLPVLRKKASAGEREDLGVRFAEVTGISLDDEAGSDAGARSSSPPRSSSAGGRTQGSAGTDGPTRKELYEKAKEKGVSGRSRMSKQELAEAVETR
ncbi:MAG TPA: hemerythrin domain-containing protein [Kineosporiaceae bacterium]